MRVPAYFLSVSRPDVEVARRRARLGPARALEPRMLVRGVVDDELGDDPEAARVRLRDEALDVAHRAVVGMNAAVVADVVAVVAGAATDRTAAARSC